MRFQIPLYLPVFCLKGIYILILWMGLLSSAFAQVNYFPQQKPVITADPAAPWAPGQTVTFTIVIDNFDIEQKNNQGIEQTAYFHGLGIEAGKCWQNLQLGTPPPTVSAEGGVWLKTLVNPPVSKCGTKGYIGYYFDGPKTYDAPTNTVVDISLDNNPLNNFGDYKQTGKWQFTWTAVVPTDLPQECDLTMRAYAFGDGETGSWKNPPPYCFESGPAEPFETGYVMQSTANFSLDTAVCLNTATKIVVMNSKLSSQTEVWDWNGGKVVKKNADGYDVLWQTPGVKKVKRILTDAETQEVLTFIRTITVFEPFSASFQVDKFSACINEPIQITYTGNAPDTAIFEWKLGDAESITGEGKGPYLVAWKEQGIKNISLQIINGACSSEVFTQNLQINTLPYALINASDTIICQNGSIIFEDAAAIQVGERYEWIFEGGIPAKAFGKEAHSISYPKAGTYKAYLNVSVGNCIQRDTVTINVSPQPQIEIGDQTDICIGQTVNLTPIVTNTSGVCFFYWSPEEGLDNPRAIAPVANPSQTTIYTFYTVCGACTSATASYTVNVLEGVKASISPQTSRICAGDKGVKLSVTLTQSKGRARIQWLPIDGLDDPSSFTPIARPSETTIYSAYGYDSTGCSFSFDSILVEVLPELTVDAGPDVSLCDVTKPVFLNATVTGGSLNYSYKWQPATGLSCTDCLVPQANPTQTTSYSLTVIDNETQCQSDVWTNTQVVVVNVVAKPLARAGQNATICEGESVTIGDLPQNGQTETYTYKWTPETGLNATDIMMPQAAPTQTTTYTLIVTNAGCDSDPATVTINVKPAPKPQLVEDSVKICKGNSVMLQAIAPGIGTKVSYRWEPKENLSDPTIANPVATPQGNTTYTVTQIIDGCASKETATVNIEVLSPPSFDAGKETVIHCPSSGGASRINANLKTTEPGRYRIRWTPETSVLDPFSLTPTLNTSVSVLMKMELFDTLTKCVYFDSVFIKVPPQFKGVLTVDKIKVCKGDTIYAQASVLNPNKNTRYTYNWNNGDKICVECKEYKFVPQATGGITVVISDGECPATLAQPVIVVEKAISRFTVSDEEACINQDITFQNQSTNAIGIQWDFGDGTIGSRATEVHTYTKPGKYTITLKAFAADNLCDDDGILSQKTIEVFEPSKAGFTSWPTPKDTFFMPNPKPIQFTNTSTGASYYEWHFGDDNKSNETNPVHQYTKEGIYKVTLYSKSPGCVDTISAYYRVLPRIFDPVIPNVFTPNGDGINDVFHVEYQGSSTIKMLIIDRWGHTIFDGQNDWNGKNKSGQEVGDGVYFYLIEIEGKKYKRDITVIR